MNSDGLPFHLSDLARPLRWVGFPLGSDVYPLAAGERPWLGIGDVRLCVPSAPWHEGGVSAWTRFPVTPQGHAAASRPGHGAHWHATTGPLASRPEAPTLLTLTKCMQSKCSLDNLALSRECKGDSGIWNVHFKASPARKHLSGEQLAGGGRPPRWSDDYRASARSGLEPGGGAMVINQIPGTPQCIIYEQPRHWLRKSIHGQGIKQESFLFFYFFIKLLTLGSVESILCSLALNNTRVGI